MPSSHALDHDIRELIVRLLTGAGTIMEDGSALALLPPVGQRELLGTIRKLEDASYAIGAVIAAARVLAGDD
jgi:hypothetical protein